MTKTTFIAWTASQKDTQDEKLLLSEMTVKMYFTAIILYIKENILKRKAVNGNRHNTKEPLFIVF